MKIHQMITKYITGIVNYLFSLCILVAIVVLLVFTMMQVYNLVIDLFNLSAIDVIHSIALIIVLVKAYRVLLFYFRKHHISIKYIVEISIIAPAIEIIFAHQNQSLPINILFGVFSLASLALYLAFHEKLTTIDKRERESTTFTL